MNDFFGQPLALNDEVAFTAPNYRWLCKGKVIAFTSKKVRVEYFNNWNYGNGNTGIRSEYLSSPDFLIKSPNKTT
jgi:hypothetical protein